MKLKVKYGLPEKLFFVLNALFQIKGLLLRLNLDII